MRSPTHVHVGRQIEPNRKISNMPLHPEHGYLPVLPLKSCLFLGHIHHVGVPVSYSAAARPLQPLDTRLSYYCYITSYWCRVGGCLALLKLDTSYKLYHPVLMILGKVTAFQWLLSNPLVLCLLSCHLFWTMHDSRACKRWSAHE